APNLSASDSARFVESKQRWTDILARNDSLKTQATLVRNISFDAGIQLEYAETNDTSVTTSTQELTNSEESAATHFGYEFNKNGLKATVKFVASTSKGDGEADGNEDALTTGYVLKDNDIGDAFTVDVAMDSVYKTPVFRVKSGQSSCPWEPGTAHREGNSLEFRDGSGALAVNVPAHEPAVFKFYFGNTSASNETMTYAFTAGPESNPHGAKLSVNGSPMDAPIFYAIPWGTSIPVTVTMERGPEEYEYDSLELVLYSLCEDIRANALGILPDDDTILYSAQYVSAHFIRPCSEVDINVPEQNFVVLNNDPIQPGTLRRITVSGYDLSNSDFQLVRVQYRRTDGDGAWINITGPGGAHERYNPNWSGFEALPDPKPPILEDDFTQYFWETAGLSDGAYEIHAWAVCTGDATDKPGFSEIIKGRIDREPPSLVGVPQPSDGVYHVGDEVSFTFNQHINCDKLIPADITQPNNVGLYDATTGQLIDIAVTCFENKIVLDPTFQNQFYENKILRAELHHIEDLTGNKRTLLEWEFYVDRNELAWLTDSVGMTKFEDENKTVVANIHNRGGSPVPFTIEHIPDWVHVVPDRGTLAANEIRPISFTVDSSLAFGNWSDSIVLHTETGQNPFFMGGDEGLPIGVRVVCRPPYGFVNANLFENTMSMVLQVNIEGELSSDPEDMVAAYLNDELRGRANVQFVPLLNKYLAYLTVYGDPDDLLDSIRLEVWDASECQRYGFAQEGFTFQPDNIIGTPNSPQVVHTGGLLLREVPFNYGWNWVSFNLAFPDNSLNAALVTLHHPDNDLIRSQGPFSIYSGGSWVGALANLNNTGMYIYRADQSDTLRMLGTPIDPASLPIPLTAGWNWIGYVPNYSLPIDDAMATVPAQPGDIIKSQVSFAQYSEVTDGPNTYFRWIGNLKYMTPPNGYQIKLANAGSLTYPPPPNPLAETPVQSRGENPQQAAANYWNVDPSQFEHSSTLIGMLRANGQNSTNNHMELGAFVGTQVRGSAQAIYIQPINAYLFFLTMYANQAGELMTFKLYNDSTQQEQNLVQTMYFSPNQHQGSIENPVPFDLPSSSAGEQSGLDLSFDVQPNPFSSEATLRFFLPKAEDVTLTVADARGREILRQQINGQAGVNTLEWNGRSSAGEWLSSGVYMVQLRTQAGGVSRKVVVQRVP
ncbi:MAG: T9SS type A sorting domain-containing protein, partial [Saprospiraceae bacterium]